MIEAARTTAMLFFILIGAIMFSYFIVQTQIATNLAAWVVSLHLPPTAVMVVVVLFYIVLGSFLESLTMILITVPVFAPLAQSIGYDLVWFGVLLVVLIEVGLIHPPMGMNLFVLQSQLPDAKIGKMYVGSAMFLLANAVLIARSIDAAGRITRLCGGSSRTSSPSSSNTHGGVAPLANWPRKQTCESRSRGCSGLPCRSR